MIFVGDIAIPHSVTPKLIGAPCQFGKAPLIGNLEGAIATPQEADESGIHLFNSTSAIQALVDMNLKVASLANNHILDVCNTPSRTRQSLDQVGIQTCGAGDSSTEAERPVLAELEDRSYAFLAFGWEVIQCRAATRSSPGVNPLRPPHVLSCVRNTREQHPDSALIVLMHWNYELEIYPQPMDRQLARACIDAGASAVIGCHSHCVQGLEWYRGALIAYGLGNWTFSEHVFHGGRLSFPRFTHEVAAIEWSPAADLLVHWFDHETEHHVLRYRYTEVAAESTRVAALTPFNNMSDAEYRQWFKHHRRKRRGLPIYNDMNDHTSNAVRGLWVFMRQALLDLCYRQGLRTTRH